MEIVKKLLMVVSSIIIIVLVAFILPQLVEQNSCKKDSLAADEFLSIYDYLEDKEFSTAKIEGSTLVLEDKDFNTIEEYDLDKKIKSKLRYIENRDTSMIFWMSGFDDLEGVMFMKSGWTDEAWNGLVRIKKIHGNAYKVYTFS
ncbi:MAG: hypothetical protein K5894_11620 [Lachnospiraceae bacterium]|nr:hypothetical protein [Lachnospiraceae bacterium]